MDFSKRKTTFTFIPPKFEYGMDMVAHKAEQNNALDELLRVPQNETGDSCILRGDITVLIQQNKMSSSLLQSKIESLLVSLPTESPLRKMKKNISEDKLLEFCKSRYIQSFSELQAWSDYISERASEFIEQSVSESVPNPDSDPNSSSTE